MEINELKWNRKLMGAFITKENVKLKLHAAKYFIHVAYAVDFIAFLSDKR